MCQLVGPCGLFVLGLAPHACWRRVHAACNDAPSCMLQQRDNWSACAMKYAAVLLNSCNAVWGHSTAAMPRMAHPTERVHAMVHSQQGPALSQGECK